MAQHSTSQTQICSVLLHLQRHVQLKVGLALQPVACQIHAPGGSASTFLSATLQRQWQTWQPPQHIQNMWRAPPARHNKEVCIHPFCKARDSILWLTPAQAAPNTSNEKRVGGNPLEIDVTPSCWIHDFPCLPSSFAGTPSDRRHLRPGSVLVCALQN